MNEKKMYVFDLSQGARVLLTLAPDYSCIRAQFWQTEYFRSF